MKVFLDENKTFKLETKEDKEMKMMTVCPF